MAATDSLAKTLCLSPISVIPSFLDCFLLSSSYSPSELLLSILAAFKGALEETSKPRLLISHAAALIHLVKKSDVSNEDFEVFIQQGLLPLISSTAADDKELIDLIEDWVSDVLATSKGFDLMKASLVPLCLRSVCLSLEISHPNELSICQWNNTEYTECSLPSITVACRILSSFMSFSLRDIALSEKFSTLDLDLAGKLKSSEAFSRELTWDLSLLTADILMQSSERRSDVIRLLFPVVLRKIYLLPSFDVLVNGNVHTFSRAHFIRKFWQSCIVMLSLGNQESRDAYNLISLHLSMLHSEEHVNYSNDEKYGIVEDDKFWEEIRKGLVNKDASIRKHSLYILKKISKHGNSPSTLLPLAPETVTVEDKTKCYGISKRGKWAETEAKSMGIGKLLNVEGVDKWSVFFLLYEMLEEYGTHLVEAAWSHQMSLFFQSDICESATHIRAGSHCQNQMQTLSRMFNWLAILWERGFFHENPQVRCLIMNSFLCMDWKSQRRYARYVPKCFILGPFILGLNDPIHHKDFGLGGHYNSTAIEGAIEFIHQYVVDLCDRERLDFVFNLANMSREESFGRAGLMAFASCLASSAMPLEQRYPRGLIDCRSSDLLNSFGAIIERTRQHFNPNYRLQVCKRVMDATSSVLCVEDVPLKMLLHFVSTLPREFTDFGGILRRKVQEWLHSEGGILKQLIHFSEDFVKCDIDIEGFDDEDLDAWTAEAQRWARLLFLMVEGDHDLDPVCQFIRDAVDGISCYETVADLSLPRFLVLVICLIDEVQIVLKKWKSYSLARCKKESSITDIPNKLPTMEAIFCLKQLTSIFLLFMEELTKRSTSACSIFWSDPIENGVILPPLMNGKLGGPSTRRLPANLTASVLHAILSVRAEASILSFIMQLGKDLDLNSSFTSLWAFCCKMILFEVQISEITSEIHLAAHEALAYVLKELSPICSSYFHEIIMSSNLHVFRVEEKKFLLDPFFLNFLSSVNGLIDKSALTRSRRAILMKWKWVCLDSLLSIPYSGSENRMYPSTSHSFFSDSTLCKATSDIVESLVNAGEESVLPLLRCVRSIIGILHANSGAVVTPYVGFDAEMMMNLVQSTLILHQSCNKRRIAPIAALLSSILHPLLFSDHSMHQTSNGDPGPFKWLIEKILEEGTKSPRTLRLAALHLTGSWFSHPSTIKYYIKELSLLSLYGSVAFDEDFAAELSENQEAIFEVSMLSKIPDSELAEVFINTETYARVAVAVLFEKLGYLALKCGNQVDNDDALSSHNAGKMFLMDLLYSAVNDKDLAKELYKKHSAIHRRKVRAWQMLCVVSGFIDGHIVDEVSTMMHVCLLRNNMPSVRQYLETFAIQIYLKFPFMVEEQLLRVFHDYDIKPQVLSSYVFIAANVILHTREVSHQLKHLNTLLPPIIPLLTSHHHSLRGFSQLLVYHVLWKLAPLLEKGSCDIMMIEKRCFGELRSYLAHNPDCVRLRASMGGIFDSFDPRNAASSCGVFNGRNQEPQFECAPVTLMEQVNEFLNNAREELRQSMAKDAMTKNNETDSENPFPQMSKGSQKHFQKKITLDDMQDISLGFEGNEFSAPEDACRLLSDLEKEDQLFCLTVQSRNHEIRQLRGREQTIIVIASLIDRIPNLAGLARTCEVFRAAGLAVADLNVVHDKQFQLISVTADKWVPIVEVPVSNLKFFLSEKKHEGFSILGLEQTTNSISIDQFSFPKKTALILGHEKEGIPVDIIHCLDACVEIPQLGVVRSLNVHVSGAIALWEYTRQHRSGVS